MAKETVNKDFVPPLLVHTVNEDFVLHYLVVSLEERELTISNVSEAEISDIVQKSSKYIYDLAMELIWDIYHPNSPFVSVIVPVSNDTQTIGGMVEEPAQSKFLSAQHENVTKIDAPGADVLDNTAGDEKVRIIVASGRAGNDAKGEGDKAGDTKVSTNHTVNMEEHNNNTTHHGASDVYRCINKNALEELLSDLFEVLGDKAVERSTLTEVMQKGGHYIGGMVEELVQRKFLSAQHENVTKIDAPGADVGYNTAGDEKVRIILSSAGGAGGDAKPEGDKTGDEKVTAAVPSSGGASDDPQGKGDKAGDEKVRIIVSSAGGAGGDAKPEGDKAGDEKVTAAVPSSGGASDDPKDEDDKVRDDKATVTFGGAGEDTKDERDKVGNAKVTATVPSGGAGQDPKDEESKVGDEN